MNSKVYDSSAVDNYLKELSERESQVTKSRKIENFRKEAPYQVLKVGGMLLALALLFYFLGLGIGHARSFEVVTINENIETRNGFHNVSDTKLTAEADVSQEQDRVINIEEILANQNNSLPATIVSSTNQKESGVRHYTIFDSVPFKGDEIYKVVTGRQFDSPESPPISSYCYADLYGEVGIDQTISLIHVTEGKKNIKKHTSSMEKNLGVSKKEFIGAMSKCTI
jgi:hypothetical protein